MTTRADLIETAARAEQWLPVPGYAEAYEVSDQGRVRSLARVVSRSDGHSRRQPERLLSQWLSTHGQYQTVTLSQDGRSRLFRVNRLVLLAFVGEPQDGEEGCHINGDPGDNRLSNLRWGSRSDNVKDQVRHGVHNMTSRTHCPNGHELAGPNLLPSVPYRKCRLCHREASRRSKARRKLALSGAPS